jgi:hypothetical protein
MDKISTMLDSGAHSLFNREIRDKDINDYSYYETDAFWEYVDNYAEFVKKNKHLLDVYVSVDVIYNFELTWKVQKYLENTHGLNPLPVFHGGDFNHFKKYLDNYEYIGIGGLSNLRSKAQWMIEMGDKIFSLICKPPDFLPTHKIHGFAITSPSILSRYPFYSVDSTSWCYLSRYGIILIPRSKGNVYDYKNAPFITYVSARPWIKGYDGHMDNFTGINQNYFMRYINDKGFKLGHSDYRTVKEGYKLEEGEYWADKKKLLVETIVEKGLCNSSEIRDQLNTLFYLDLEKNLPEWPWAWKPNTKIKPLF